MAKRKEQRGADVVRLQALYDAGDWRDARRAARRLAESASEPDRILAAALLRRLRPEPAALLAASAGFVLLGVVAALGLFFR